MVQNLIALFLILLQSSSALAGGFELPVGTVITFAGSLCPDGTVSTDGTSLLRAGKYARLFTAIGTAHGFVDGTHFNLPDYKGRFLRMINAASGRDPDAASRTAMATGGATGDNIGSVQLDEFKSHTHTLKSGILLNTTTSMSGRTASFANFASTFDDAIDNPAGGNETRPLNAYVNYCIKY